MRRSTATLPLLVLALILAATTFLSPVQASLGYSATTESIPLCGAEETIAAAHVRLHSAPRAEMGVAVDIAPPAAALPALNRLAANPSSPTPPAPPACQGPPPSLRAPPALS